MKLKIILYGFIVLVCNACKALKPYERAYLNDSEMQLEDSSPKNFENDVHSIREGATPAAGSKSSGGCGCN